MEAGWFAHVTVRPDAVIFVKFVICGGAAVGVVVVPEEVFVVVDVVVVGVVVVAGLIVRVTGSKTLPPLERSTDTVVV